MSRFSYSDATLKRLLQVPQTIACVGLSTNPIRPSFFVARYLQLKGFRIIPVNPAYAGQAVLGEEILPDLAATTVSVDIVDIFRRSEHAGGVVDEALRLTPLPRTIWMQIGVMDEAAAARAEALGPDVVMDRCPKIEYQRLFGELRMGGFATGIISSRL